MPSSFIGGLRGSKRPAILLSNSFYLSSNKVWPRKMCMASSRRLFQVQFLLENWGGEREREREREKERGGIECVHARERMRNGAKRMVFFLPINP